MSAQLLGKRPSTFAKHSPLIRGIIAPLTIMKRSLSLTADEEVEVEAKAPRIAQAEEDSLAPPDESPRFAVTAPPAAFAAMLPELWTTVFTLGDLRAWLGYAATFQHDRLLNASVVNCPLGHRCLSSRNRRPSCLSGAAALSTRFSDAHLAS